jgi:SAM-dependent methyltransferase
MNNFISKVFLSLFPFVKSYCPVCGKANSGFSALPDYYRENALKYGYPYFGKGEMTTLETYSCINCGASDRERLYAYWIGFQLKDGKLSNKSRIIHFAPETALYNRLRTMNWDCYHTADLMMDGCDFKIDMMQMPFEDEYYDFFICSHILEHVESDDKAISELFRITKRGGCGILMAPIIVGLKNTVEDLSVTDDYDRWRFYGQNDHVRLYAHYDYVNKIRSHGFLVEELVEEYFGKKVYRSLGLKRTSILYVVSK